MTTSGGKASNLHVRSDAETMSREALPLQTRA
jgi:hypothetical protein